jgi:putative transposase
LNKQVIEELNLLFTEICNKWEVELLEFGAELDHVHLLIDFNPTIQPSKFVNNLKTVSSRLLRKKFSAHLSQFYWKPVLWSRSYCLVSTGGAPLEVIKKYLVVP